MAKSSRPPQSKAREPRGAECRECGEPVRGNANWISEFIPDAAPAFWHLECWNRAYRKQLEAA
jgi:hypothetical protein